MKLDLIKEKKIVGTLHVDHSSRPIVTSIYISKKSLFYFLVTASYLSN